MLTIWRNSSRDQRMEHHDLVDAIEELRTKAPAQHLQRLFLHLLVVLALVSKDEIARDVRGHDHDGVLEIHRPPLPIREPAVVEQLQQDVEDVVMGLFDLVEQDDRVGPPPHGFGQLAALLESDVARRRADQPRDRMLLHVFRHVDPHHRGLVVEQELGKRARELGFADAGRPQEDERSDWAVGILQARAGPNHRVGDRLHRLVLADHAFVQLLLEMRKFLDLALHQARHRNAGPARDDLGDVLFVDLLLDQPRGAARRRVARLGLGKFLFQPRQPPVLQFGDLVQVVLALGLFDLDPGLLDLRLDAGELLDRALFALPLGLQGVALVADFGQFFLEPLAAGRARPRRFRA